MKSHATHVRIDAHSLFFFMFFILLPNRLMGSTRPHGTRYWAHTHTHTQQRVKMACHKLLAHTLFHLQHACCCVRAIPNELSIDASTYTFDNWSTTRRMCTICAIRLCFDACRISAIPSRSAPIPIKFVTLAYAHNNIFICGGSHNTRKTFFSLNIKYQICKMDIAYS